MKIELTPFRVMISGLFITVVLIVVWLGLLFTASPNPTVDYVALYNASNKPEGFDESKNAWPVYEQAMAAAVKIPDDVINWLDYPVKELSQEKLAEIEKALTANKRSLDLMRQAGELPYYYIERVSDDGSMLNILMPELSNLKLLAKVMALDCQYNIYKGDFDQAISDIVCIDKLARHMHKETVSLIEQLVGESIRQLWIKQGCVLTAQTDMTDSQISRLHDFVNLAIDDLFIISFDVEQQYIYDITQRMHVGSKNGNGRLAWKCRWEMEMFMGFGSHGGSADWEKEWKAFLKCAFGVKQKEVEEKYEKWHELFLKIRPMTPWQYHQDKTGIKADMENISSWISAESFNMLSSIVCINISYTSKANLLGLQTVLAIREFKLANNRLPQSLAELVEKQYLKEVPLDPFSDGELVYKVDGDSYRLYSWGKDLKDNSGRRGDDFVFWPLPDVDKMMVSGSQAVEAINKFQQEQNRLPLSLKELVEKQYLEEVPLDPFSDGELVYEVYGDSYLLYSIGSDLFDNGCSRDSDFAFWPLSGVEIIDPRILDPRMWPIYESESESEADETTEAAMQPESGLRSEPEPNAGQISVD